MAGIPYIIHGGISFYERKEVKDLTAYLQLAIDPHNDNAFKRVFNVPSRYLGKAYYEKVKAYNGSHYEAIQGNIAMRDYESRGSREFTQLINELRSRMETQTPRELVEFLMDECYTQYLKEEGEDEEEGSSRFENIETLKFALSNYESIQDFLNYIELMTTQAETSIDGVHLMTIHKSKGLEFKTTFIVGCSQGLLPHFKSVESASKGNPMAIEEERRLLYVAITRAEEDCYLSSTGSFNGKAQPVSMFIPELDLPMEVNPSMEILEEDELIEEEYGRMVYDRIAMEEREIRRNAVGE